MSTSPRNRSPVGLPVHISKESHNHRPQSRHDCTEFWNPLSPPFVSHWEQKEHSSDTRAC